MVDTAAPSQPAAVDTGTDVVAAFNKGLAALDSQEQPASEIPPAEPAQPATQASIVIPISKIPEKFRSNPDQVFDSYLSAERTMHETRAETARYRRENEALQARLAAAEQVNRMTPAQQAPEPNLSEMVITETPRFVDTIEQRAVRAAREEAQKATGQFRDEQNAKDQAYALINTFERAKDLARKQGYTFTDEEWKKQIGYIAPVVVRENEQNPSAVYDPNQYLSRLQELRGAPPKATMPAEGNPPVAVRSAGSPPTAPSAPTLSREAQQVDSQIRGALAHLLAKGN